MYVCVYVCVNDNPSKPLYVCEYFFIVFSYLNEKLAGYKILDFQLFPFKTNLHYLLVFSHPILLLGAGCPLDHCFFEENLSFCSLHALRNVLLSLLLGTERYNLRTLISSFSFEKSLGFISSTISSFSFFLSQRFYDSDIGTFTSILATP